MRRAVVLVGLLPWLLGAQFPSAIYDHVTKNATCTAVPSDCGVGSEATCGGAGQACLYTATKMNNVADEVEAIETALGANLANVLEPGDIDTSAELAAILTNETGSGPVCFGNGPTLTGPVIGTSTVAALPAAGTRVGAVYLVTDSQGTCASGGGGLLIFCRDNGSSYTAVSSGVGGEQQYDRCFALNPAETTSDEIEFWIVPYSIRLIEAVCHCDGACDSPTGTLAFGKRGGGSAFTAISLTGGGSLACDTSTTSSTFTTFDTSDADRIIARGHALRVSVSNTPTTLDRVTLCVVFSRV